MEASNNKDKEATEKEVYGRLPEWCKIILNLSKKGKLFK